MLETWVTVSLCAVPTEAELCLFQRGESIIPANNWRNSTILFPPSSCSFCCLLCFFTASRNTAFSWRRKPEFHEIYPNQKILLPSHIMHNSLKLIAELPQISLGEDFILCIFMKRVGIQGHAFCHYGRKQSQAITVSEPNLANESVISSWSLIWNWTAAFFSSHSVKPKSSPNSPGSSAQRKR